LIEHAAHLLETRVLALESRIKDHEKLPGAAAPSAVREARSGCGNHIERNEGLAAIYPAMMNSMFG